MINWQAKRYYDLIPPYLAHKDDWARLLPEWVDQAPKVMVLMMVMMVIMMVMIVMMMMVLMIIRC